jgi:hypothetical protein
MVQTVKKILQHMVGQKICAPSNLYISASIWAMNFILSLLTSYNSPVSDFSEMYRMPRKIVFLQKICSVQQNYLLSVGHQDVVEKLKKN